MDLMADKKTSIMTDSADSSKAKVTVEAPHSSVKMRAASQLPAVGPDDDLTGMLLQVGNNLLGCFSYLCCINFPHEVTHGSTQHLQA